MSRAELRRDKRNQGKIYHLTEEQLREYKKSAYEDAKEYQKKVLAGKMDEIALTAFVEVMSLSLYVLNKEYGFGKKRLPDFAEKCIDLYEKMDKTGVDFDTMRKYYEEKTGMKIKIVDDNR